MGRLVPWRTRSNPTSRGRRWATVEWWRPSARRAARADPGAPAQPLQIIAGDPAYRACSVGLARSRHRGRDERREMMELALSETCSGGLSAFEEADGLKSRRKSATRTRHGEKIGRSARHTDAVDHREPYDVREPVAGRLHSNLAATIVRPWTRRNDRTHRTAQSPGRHAKKREHRHQQQARRRAVARALRVQVSAAREDVACRCSSQGAVHLEKSCGAQAIIDELLDKATAEQRAFNAESAEERRDRRETREASSRRLWLLCDPGVLCV